MTSKRCRVCHTRKSAGAFHRDSTSLDGPTAQVQGVLKTAVAKVLWSTLPTPAIRKRGSSKGKESQVISGAGSLHIRQDERRRKSAERAMRLGDFFDLYIRLCDLARQYQPRAPLSDVTRQVDKLLLRTVGRGVAVQMMEKILDIHEVSHEFAVRWATPETIKDLQRDSDLLADHLFRLGEKILRPR